MIDQMFLSPLYWIFIAFVFTLGLTSLCLRYGWGSSIIDKPNDRSLHVQPTPRVGGILLLIAAATTWALIRFQLAIEQPTPFLFMASVIAIFACGALDDRLQLSAQLRLAVHLLAASMIVYVLQADNPPSYPILWVCVVVLTIVWSTNLVNFMDGANGMIGLSSLVCFGTYAILCPAPAATFLMLGLWSLVGALLGFLWFNWTPAKIFLGDAGSTTLGFLMAVVGLWGIQHDYWHWMLPIACTGPLVFDASYTVLRRILAREKFWQAHRSHLYQRLITVGHLDHLTVSLSYAGVAAASTLILFTAGVSSNLMRYCAAVFLTFTYVCTYYILNRWLRTKN